MHVAVFLPNWVGDVVMATPALRAIRQRYPNARLTAVMKPYVAAVVEGAPWFDRTLLLSRRWPATAFALRTDRPDLTVVFPNSFRSALVAWLGGSRRIVGFNRYARGLLLTDKLEPHRHADGTLKICPIIDDYNRLAEAAGCESPGHRMELFTTPADEAAADRVWLQTGLIAAREIVLLNPGAAFGAAKHWSVGAFAALARDLVDRRGSQVLVLCGPGERETARQIARFADRRGRVHSLADTSLSLGLTKALVRRCDVLVTTDSGPRHFAAAFDRPVVTLFGPTHIEWTETYFPQAIHLQKKVPCGPCQKRTCPLDHRCMTELTPTEVFHAAEQLLAGQRRRNVG